MLKYNQDLVKKYGFIKGLVPLIPTFNKAYTDFLATNPDTQALYEFSFSYMTHACARKSEAKKQLKEPTGDFSDAYKNITPNLQIKNYEQVEKYAAALFVNTCLIDADVEQGRKNYIESFEKLTKEVKDNFAIKADSPFIINPIALLYDKVPEWYPVGKRQLNPVNWIKASYIKLSTHILAGKYETVHDLFFQNDVDMFFLKTLNPKGMNFSPEFLK